MSRYTITALALGALGFSAGCRTPAVYEVAYHDALAVWVEARDASGTEATLRDGATRAQLVVDGPRLGPAQAQGYAARLSRVSDGAVDFAFTSSVAVAEAARLLTADGAVAIDFPTVTGDLLDFPGFHLDGVTGMSGPPMSIEDGVHRLHFTFRPKYETQRQLGWSPDVRLALRTPTDNVRSVIRVERGGAAWGLVAGVGAVLAGAGVAFLASSVGGDDGAGFRLGVGLPLLGVGLAAGGYGLFQFLRPERRVSIPPEAAAGAP